MCYIIVFVPADCITDLIIVCDDLLRYCQHCWRVQRHGCLLRAQKQVSWVAAPSPMIIRLFVSSAIRESGLTAFIVTVWINSLRYTMNLPKLLFLIWGQYVLKARCNLKSITIGVVLIIFNHNVNSKHFRQIWQIIKCMLWRTGHFLN